VEDELDDGDDSEASSDEDVYYQTVAMGGRRGKCEAGGGATGLWAVLSRVGCPDKFVKIVQSFHDGMLASVLDGVSASSTFTITCGTKQGCILAPLLFSIFFAMLLYVAFHDCTVGIPLTFCTDRNLPYSTCAISSHRAKPHSPSYVNSCSLTTVPTYTTGSSDAT